MKAYLERFKLVAVLFFALAYIGCEDDDIEQLPEVIALFTQTTNPDTGTVRFLNLSENADTYEWDFGDGTTSTEINPIKSFGTGDYTITLTAFNSAGASASFEDQISIVLPEVIALPITFDNDNIDYTPTTFDGTSFEVVANPDVSGSNDKESNVGAITNSGAEFEGIFFDLGVPADLTDQQSISMNFWSEAPVDVLMKLEEGSGADVETAVTHGGTGWEEIVFDFSSSDSFSRITIFVDGPGTATGTFYLDDIALSGDSGGGGDCTAETEQSLAAADFNLTFQTDPGDAIISDGGAFSYIDNPDTDNEVNPSCKVGQIDRDPGLEFANTQIEFESKFDFNANAGFKLKVWAPAAGTNVLLKLEDKSNGAVFAEVTATTTLANAWEELTFDFPASESDKFDKIVLFFELGTFTGETYYIDDFALYSGDGGGTDCEAETEQSLAATDFNLTFQTDPGDAITSDGGAFSYIDNPDTDNEVNPSCKVGQIDRDPGLEFANTQIEFDGKFDFNANAGFKLKVWAPAAGTNVLVKLEDKTNGAVFTEVAAVTTSANAWEELTFDFPASASDTYDKIVLFFELGTFTGETYYIDDFALYAREGGGGGDMPSEAAPAPPSRDAADVISLFSNAYTDITVDTFYAAFSVGGGVADEQVAGDDVKLYTDLDFAGIETISETVDLSGMTNFHIDVWTATGFDLVTGVVDFGGDGFGGANPDTRGDARTTLSAGQWTSIDVSIADLQAAGLTGTPTDFSQLILDVADVTGTIYVDNMYFYNDGSGGGGDTPSAAAPTPPSRDAADVISLFSNAYTDITVDTFYAAFSAGGGQTDEQVAGDDVKLYTDLDFAGIETISETVDLSGMTNFHIDVWTATGFDLVTGVVDFGGDGFGGANPDTRGDARTTLSAGQWTSIDVSIADLQAAGLTGTPTDFSQLILDVADVTGTIYVDNIYFYNEGAGGGASSGCSDTPVAATALPLDFEGCETFLSDQNFGAGLTSGLAANPSKTGINTSDFVLQVDKPTGSDFFAGIQNVFPSNFDLTTTDTFKIKVYSTKANVVFRFELLANPNDGSIGNPAPVFVTVPVANEWTEIEFTFTGLPAGPTAYSQLVIKPDNDQSDSPITEGGTYYLDDLILE